MKTHFPPIRTIIVDDEKPSREIIHDYINEYFPDLEVVALSDSAISAFRDIERFEPQLVFLDIEMPGKNGFELLKMFKKIDFHVVFTTAFSDYATEAFRVSAIDFLVKPIKISELNEAISRVKDNIGRQVAGNIIGML